MLSLFKSENNEIFEKENYLEIIKINIIPKDNSNSKIIIILIIFLIIFGFKCKYIFEHNEIKKRYIQKNNYKIEIEIDNKYTENKFETNVDYSSYSTKIKPIALYFPNLYLDDFVDKISLYKKHNNKISINYYNIKKVKKMNKSLVLFKKNYANRLQGNTYFEYRFILRQINLAKTHGIYGFGVYIYWYSGNIFFDKYINQFLEINNINFHFLFILNNKNIDTQHRKNIIIKNYSKNYPEKLIMKLKPYILDKRYIYLNSKPIICIDDNFEENKNIITIASLFRQYAQKIGIGELFLISSLTDKNPVRLQNLKQIFDAGYELLPNLLLKENLLINFNDNLTFFSGLIYKDMNFIDSNEFPIFRGCTLENKIKISNHSIFRDYYPEYFYIMNKIIINWTLIYHNDSDNFIFINSWNNYFDGSYLEPNYEFGYGSINSISKALFSINFINKPYNLSNLFIISCVIVQVHIFYIDLINEVINNTNNIPVKYDLYVTTDTMKKKIIIENYLKKHSNANNYQIKIMKNKGRDILPLLNQIKKVFHKYKYFCHIHAKKSIKVPEYGCAWRKYLFKNILGSRDLISNILTDFENEEKLGFIFPETFYEAKVYALEMDDKLENCINYLLNKIFNQFKMGTLFDFPAGDMFWAKIKAIYQMFIIDFNDDIYDEGKSLTMLYAFERIWLYIVKLNGFFYKKTCEYY